MTILSIPGEQYTIEVKFVTPDLARAMLSCLHPDQRKMRSPHVVTLAAHMQAGRFKGIDTIKLDENGTVIDGQHRLQAIVDSQQGQYLIVVGNVPESLNQYLDQGATRSEGDRLKIQYGVNPTSGVKTALKLLRTDLHMSNYNLKIYKENITLMYEDFLTHETALKLLSQLDETKKRGIKWLNGPQLAAAIVLLYKYDLSIEAAGTLWRWAHLASHGTSVGGGVTDLEEHNGRKFFDAIRSKRHGLSGREIMRNYQFAMHIAEQHMLGKKAQFKPKEKHSWIFPNSPAQK